MPNPPKNPFVPWADYYQQFKQVQEYQALLAVSRLKKFKFNPADNWVYMDFDMVPYPTFLTEINPDHRDQVKASLEECLKTGQPTDLRFDATFAPHYQSSTYQLRIHAPEGIAVGLYHLVDNENVTKRLSSPNLLTQADTEFNSAARLALISMIQGEPLPSARRLSIEANPVKTLDDSAVNTEPYADLDSLPSSPPEATKAASVSPRSGALNKEGRDLVLYYQPQANLDTNEITGIEAFLRKWDPQRGLVSPSPFLAEMEASGELAGITEWLVTTSLNHLVECQQRVHRPLRLTLNLRPTQLLDTAFIEHLAYLKSLHAAELDRCIAICIPVPLLERTYQQADWDQLAALMDLMASSGISPILEGYGYPNLKLPAKAQTQLLARAVEVKINVNYFRGFDFNTQVGDISNWGLNLAAHGVEDMYTLDTLASLSYLKVHTYQGNLLAAPMAIEGLRDFLVN